MLRESDNISEIYVLHVDMITITLDTSCLDLRYPELHELKKLKDKGQIELWMEQDTQYEKEQWKNIGLKNDAILWMWSNLRCKKYAYEIPHGRTIEDVELWSQSEYEKTFKKVREIHSPEFKRLKQLPQNKYFDWTILTYHILRKRDFFVTKDTSDFIDDGRKEKFENEFGIQIRELNQEFLNELKEKIM